MPAYYRATIAEFLNAEPDRIIGSLQVAYAADGFSSQYSKQTQAWATAIPILQNEFRSLILARSAAANWTIVLEYPLYRLRKRIDVVVLTESLVIVIECKVGSTDFPAQDRRQVEQYALDLQDFHEASRLYRIVPILWSTAAIHLPSDYPEYASQSAQVAPVIYVGAQGLSARIAALNATSSVPHIVAEAWDYSAYRPVPNIIEAATSIFSGHDISAIANADADNLHVASARLIALIREAQEQKKRYMLFLSGVPGAGKTLAGLHVVHGAISTGVEHEGDIVYLSGNTPLVVVLREALSLNEYERNRSSKLDDIRRSVRARIQHINDFLQQGILHDANTPPHEHVIIFDEAQRAWDEKQGLEKFNRTASEPELIVELMERHKDWCVCICLVGGGQEINSGEKGVLGWGDALRKLSIERQGQWTVFAPPHVLHGGVSAGSFTLGELPTAISTYEENELQLSVPMRSYRSPKLSQWVNHVLAGDIDAALATAMELGAYPLYVTRSLPKAKQWLKGHAKGHRRYGLLASSGARRLRADGIGTFLHATSGAEIAHWYLNDPGDIRSSYALEVPANEYTCQGLELDFTCLCWGGDLLWDTSQSTWQHSRLSGNAWQKQRTPVAQQFSENSYRVLLTRAREGMILWVPEGDAIDHTRAPGPLDATAEILVRCGCILL
ncbi:DUF2075 domain-containing protein [Duganella sp. PWIR1]